MWACGPGVAIPVRANPNYGLPKKGMFTCGRKGAHYILGYRGPDTDLRRWGLKLAARGGKRAKKAAIIAVARKLGILLHHLWATGEVYEPLYNVSLQQARKKVAA